MSFVVLNCQVVEWVDIFANPVFKNPGILAFHGFFLADTTPVTLLRYPWFFLSPSKRSKIALISSISFRLFISPPAMRPAHSFSCLVIDGFNLSFPAFKFSTFIKVSPAEPKILVALPKKRDNKRCPTHHKPDPKMAWKSFFLQNSSFYSTFCFKIRIEGSRQCFSLPLDVCKESIQRM